MKVTLKLAKLTYLMLKTPMQKGDAMEPMFEIINMDNSEDKDIEVTCTHILSSSYRWEVPLTKNIVGYRTSFDTLKRSLKEPLTLIFPDQNDTYCLYTAASQYAWCRLLIRKCTHTDKTGNTVAVYQPIIFLDCTFTDFQQIPSLVKGGSIIYISAWKLSMYLEEVGEILQSDHNH